MTCQRSHGERKWDSHQGYGTLRHSLVLAPWCRGFVMYLGPQGTLHEFCLMDWVSLGKPLFPWPGGWVGGLGKAELSRNSFAPASGPTPPC